MIYILNVLDKEYNDLYATLAFTSESNLTDAIKLIEDYDYNYYAQDEHDTEYNDGLYELLDYIREEYNTVQVELNEVYIR